MLKNITKLQNIITLIQNNITWHLTDNRKIITYGLLIIILGLLNITLGIPNNVFNNASAESYESAQNISFTLNPSISVTVSGDLTITNLTPGDYKDSNNITVTASSNSIAGYSLYANTGSSSNNSNELRKDGTSTTNKFTSITTDVASLSDFTDNTWGYSYCNVSTNCATSTNWTNYSYLPKYSDSNDKLLITNNTNTTTSLEFKIGARASTTQIAGEYTNVINFIGVANPNPQVKTLDQVTTMQEDFSCLATSDGVTKSLIDKRDGEQYLITKFTDGNCWMLDNLRLDPTNIATRTYMLNNNETNASNEMVSHYFNGGDTGNAGWATVAVAYADSDFDSLTNPQINNSLVNDTAVGYGIGSKKIGVYYNYCAATIGTYCYASGSAPEDANAEYDVCPAGWRMPTGNVNGEYQMLCDAIYGDTCPVTATMSGTDPNSLQYKLSTPLAGYYLKQVNNKDKYYDSWSSTRSTGNRIYSLTVNESWTKPRNDYNSRANGFSMRCIKTS